MILEPVMMNAGIILPARGLPGRAEGAAAQPRRAAGLRRGQDRLHRPARRGHRDVRRDARHRRAWPRRSAAGCPSAAIGGTEEVMSAIADGALRAGRHVQRQPAGHGREPGHADRGAHARRRTRTSTRCGERMVDGRRRRSSPSTTLPGDVVALGRQGLRRRSAASRSATTATSSDIDERLRPRALADPAQRRRVPAAVGEDRAVDALGPAHRGRRRPVRRQLRAVRRRGTLG